MGVCECSKCESHRFVSTFSAALHPQENLHQRDTAATTITTSSARYHSSTASGPVGSLEYCCNNCCNTQEHRTGRGWPTLFASAPRVSLAVRSLTATSSLPCILALPPCIPTADPTPSPCDHQPPLNLYHLPASKALQQLAVALEGICGTGRQAASGAMALLVQIWQSVCARIRACVRAQGKMDREQGMGWAAGTK